MPSNTNYIVQTWVEMEASRVAPSIIGISGSCSAGGSSNIDYVLSDDVFIRGLEFLSEASVFGDTITLQIIDTNGITGVDPGTVIATPITNWYVPSISKSLQYTALIPKKLLSSFTIRLIYTSTGEEDSVNIGINYLFLKALI